MLDIHSHILPGIDDGARNIGHSLEMARKYVMAGYTRVIATPHAVPEDRGVRFARSIDLHVANLNAIMQEDRVALTVMLDVVMNCMCEDLLQARGQRVGRNHPPPNE